MFNIFLLVSYFGVCENIFPDTILVLVLSGRVQNEPGFGHNWLSKGVLLRILDRLPRKLLFQRTGGSRKKPGNEVPNYPIS